MEDIASLYGEGLSCFDIAEIYGCNAETIRKRLIRLGIGRRPKSFKKPKKVPSWEEYFSDKIEVCGECLLWTGFRDEAGYGRCSAAFAPSIFFAHRISWFLKHGPFDLSRRVLHTCDTPPCVNADHLWLGTQIENIADMISKNRQRGGRGFLSGEDHPFARLSEREVTEMRKIRDNTGLPFHKIAKQFGVTTMTAWRACSGHLWKHLQEAP